MKTYLAIIAAVLAAGCSPQKTDTSAAASTAEVAAPEAADMSISDTEHRDRTAGDKMGMSGEQHAKMSSGTTAPASAVAGAGTSAMATGTVDKIDAVAGTITISHGPVESLKWPAMTMGFKATPEQVASVKPGQEVLFEFNSSGMDATITAIKSR